MPAEVTMRRHARFLTPLLVMALLAATPAVAQEDGVEEPPTRFNMWGTLAGSPDLGLLALTARVDHLVLSGRLSGWDFECDDPDCLPAVDLGVLAGYGGHFAGNVHWYAAAGIGAASNDVAEYLSFPFQAEIGWAPFKFLGFGLIGSAAIGTGSDPSGISRSYVRVGVGVDMGQLR
jgi:hypothetical protein